MLAFTVRPYELVVEAFSAEALNNRVWLLVEVAKFPRSGAPVTPRVARSVKSPAPMLLMASVGAFTRKFRWSAMLPLAWVFVRARLS